MGAMSFLHTSLRGAYRFIAATASLVVAFSIAITGPPTRSELSALQSGLSQVWREAQAALTSLGSEHPASVQETETAPREEVVLAPPPRPLPKEDIAPPVAEALPPTDTELLGGDTRETRRAPAPRETQRPRQARPIRPAPSQRAESPQAQHAPRVVAPPVTPRVTPPPTAPRASAPVAPQRAEPAPAPAPRKIIRDNPAPVDRDSYAERSVEDDYYARYGDDEEPYYAEDEEPQYEDEYYYEDERDDRWRRRWRD